MNVASNILAVWLSSLRRSIEAYKKTVSIPRFENFDNASAENISYQFIFSVVILWPGMDDTQRVGSYLKYFTEMICSP